MSTFRDIISGDRRDPWAALARGGLGVLSAGYTALTALRNRYYDAIPPAQLSKPCISVGNLTAGGTGKTPMVAWLARQLAERGARVAIVSRGYKGDAGGNDEHALLEEACPQAICLVDPDRVRGGQRAIQQHRADIIILDDGFQHRRLARDLNIVLIDALCPDGYGHVLPRGLLRERFSGLRRAHVIVLTRISQVPATRATELRERCAALSSAAVLGCNHQPRDVVDLPGQARPLERLQGHEILAFAGIGNPDGFRSSLTQLGAAPSHMITFADHHHYCLEDCRQIAAAAARMNANVLLTTEKDMVKLRQLPFDWNLTLLALRVDIDFIGEGGRILSEHAVGLLEEGPSPDDPTRL